MTSNELLSYLRDAAQGASNSAASNVSGPVDLLAWLLRKGGVPVPQNALGGSQWMAEKGLTAQPKNALAGMAGETLGMVGPIVAAAKAPQIANALLKVGENAAARPMLNPQTGAIVWHGSPHKFDKFDASKIGTGEGAQAYGHGLYLADSPDVAKGYRAETAFKHKPGGIAGMLYSQKLGDADAAMKSLRQEMAQYDRKGWPSPTYRNQYDDALSKLAQWKKTPPNEGALYKVDLPDEHIAKMLDWDKPLSQQAPGVQKAVTDAMLKRGITKSVADYIVANKTGNEALATISRGAYDARLNVPDGPQAAAASQMLQSAGIPGIRYLDGGSRGAGSGTSNYVIFPQNENLLRILERNGVPIGQ